MIPERQMIMGVDGDGESAERAVAALDARPGRLEHVVDGVVDGLRGGGPSTTRMPNLTAARCEAKLVDGGLRRKKKKNTHILYI